MPRSYWRYIAPALGCLIVAALIGWRLQPKEPNLTSDGGYQEQSSYYRAGGSECEPAQLKVFAGPKRLHKTDACEEAKEQHREAANQLLEARRSANAANAQAIIANQQTGIAGWGMGLGFVTMIAAIGAAFYAREAAIYTRRAATFSGVSLRQTKRSLGLAEASNKLTLDAQRAWMTIKPEVTLSVSDGDRLLFVDGVIRFTNIGNTVATNVLVAGGASQEPLDIATEREIFSENQKIYPFIPRSIIPDERITFQFRASFAKNLIADRSRDGRIYLCVYALCDYGLANEPTAERATDGVWRISIGEETDFLSGGIPLDALPNNEDIKLTGGTVKAI
jgi:hypothetical protein